VLGEHGCTGDGERVGDGVVEGAARLAAPEGGVERSGRVAGEKEVVAVKPRGGGAPAGDRGGAEQHRAAERGRGSLELPTELAEFVPARRGPGKILARHCRAGMDNDQVGPLKNAQEEGVGAELVDGEVADPVAAPVQDARNLPDLGGEVRRDPQAGGLVHVAVEQDRARGHGRAGGGGAGRSGACRASSG